MTEQLPESEGQTQKEPPRFNRRLWMINAGIWAVAGAVTWNTHRIKQNARREVEELFAVEKYPRSTPETLSADPEFQKMLEKNFKVIAGNASYEDAKVIGIGEVHFLNVLRGSVDKEMRKKAFVSANTIGRMFSDTAKSGDHFLLEGIDRRREVPPKKSLPLTYPWTIGLYDRDDITMSGWDDLKAMDDTTLLIPESAKIRNEKGMIPAIYESIEQHSGKTFVVAGAGHFVNDPRIDESLEKAKIPYLILGENFALEVVEKGYEEFRRSLK
jgi:hypothetical protein